jgi:membrane protease YdiL (CAAX protease family)
MQDDAAAGQSTGVSWTGGDIILVVFFALGFWPALCGQLLSWTGFYEQLYGPDFHATLTDNSDPNRELAWTRFALWATLLAFPLQVLTAPVVFRLLRGTRPKELGLTTQNLGRNLLRGFLGWLLLAPVVWAVYWLTVLLYNQWVPGGTETHPLDQLGHKGAFRSDWVLLVLEAVVAAPVLEELLCRGVIQPWCGQDHWRSHGVLTLAGVVALLKRQDRLTNAWGEGAGPLLDALAPVLFVLALVPLYLGVCRRDGRASAAGPALFATAALFAASHSSVWPSPVALFILGLGLGRLAQRTGSLAGPILLHALLNGVACVELLLPWR